MEKVYALAIRRGLIQFLQSLEDYMQANGWLKSRITRPGKAVHTDDDLA